VATEWGTALCEELAFKGDTAQVARVGTHPTRTQNRPSASVQPASASGTAALLGIWMSISSVDMVSPRSMETFR